MPTSQAAMRWGAGGGAVERGIGRGVGAHWKRPDACGALGPGKRCGKWYAGGRRHGILAGGGAASGAHAHGAVGGGAGSPTVLGLGRVCKVAR